MEQKGIERVYRDVEFLTSLRPFRNYLNTDSLNKASHYIYESFKQYSDCVSFQEFEAYGNTYRNVLCSINTEKEERIIIGAHYDVAGDTPGADDNASCIAGLLEILRLLYDKKTRHRIDFAAYVLEEPPFFGTEKMGSFIHAKSLYENSVKIKVMISLEMIGFFSDKKNSQQFPLPFMRLFYPDTGNFIGVVGNTFQRKITVRIRDLMRKGSDIPVYSLNAPSIIPGVDFSDHRNFWRFGYNAVMITDTAFYRNPNYHRRTDTIATLDFDRMYSVIKSVAYAVLNL
ncbi:Peptidase family M28 [Persephonella hydrogeniphila]|uniref:Peptidase family M28 n=1 Tax=Persephonella hydrogeniphila TaxID=198703 RepID=A0A285NB65_9AQUI|nr:M28 family peptidase [Persephonella hydrogeniphila]SNZ06705.1 Peptidase family M28 [Persephonella hydrogeniphila]